MKGSIAPEGADDLDLVPLEPIKEIFVALAKALRAHRLYDENNPVYTRFVNNFGDALRRVWQDSDVLQVQIDEHRILFMGDEVYQSEDRNDSISFMFWKDGIREIIFQKGLEDSELIPFLAALQRSRTLTADGEDLLTVLWESDFQFFRYGYVDLLAEGVAVPVAGETLVDLSLVLQGEMGGTELSAGGEDEEEASDGLKPSVNPDDFNPTLYSLGPSEMKHFRDEIAAEMSRDLRGEVLACLFDRLEEPEHPERQTEIVQILSQLLPNFLSKGALGSVGQILQEISWLAGESGLVSDGVRGEIRVIIDEMSSQAALTELVQALRDGSIAPDVTALGHLLKFLNPTSLITLLRLARESGEVLRPVLREGVHGMAMRSPQMVGKLLSSKDPVLVSEAVLLIGRLGMTKGIPAVGKLAAHPDGRVRLACLEVMVRLKAASLYSHIETLLGDPERGVRIAAARAVGMLRYQPARNWLSGRLESKELREADLSERRAVFQSYGTLADKNALTLLDRFLNGRNFIGRREDDETRACAALALSQIPGDAARAILMKARDEQSPMVRNAVRKALKPPTQARTETS